MSKSSKKKADPEISVNRQQIIENLIPVVEETAGDLNLIVLETTFNKEKGQYFLRIFIYNPEKPVDHEDCVNMTRTLNAKLDESNLIPVSYSLEVSSPGINRKLKNPVEYTVFKDREVKITLKKELAEKETTSTITGKLIGLSDNMEEAIIEKDNQQKRYKLKGIKTIQLEG
jgi:ribosome maturation factor RimP